MTHIAIIGAGITGVTTAYALLERGYQVTVLDRHRYPAMETSFANGGQLSASNAEVWNKHIDGIQGPALDVQARCAASHEPIAELAQIFMDG